MIVRHSETHLYTHYYIIVYTAVRTIRRRTWNGRPSVHASLYYASMLSTRFKMSELQHIIKRVIRQTKDIHAYVRSTEPLRGAAAVSAFKSVDRKNYFDIRADCTVGCIK